MNELPDNIFPKLIESVVNDLDSIENEFDDLDGVDESLKNENDEHFTCQFNQVLNDKQIQRIKNEAHFAYEKQSRYQEDILIRTKRLITRFRHASERFV